MQNIKEELLNNLDKIHTTDLGVIRIKRNLSLDADNVVMWCKDKISSSNSDVSKKGKNFYVSIDHFILTINAHSYTIITAHKIDDKTKRL